MAAGAGALPARGYSGRWDQGVQAMQHPILTGHDGGKRDDDALTGEHVLNEIYDLIRRRLPLIPLDDPARTCLAALAPALGESLGRPRAVAVPEVRQRAARPHQ